MHHLRTHVWLALRDDVQTLIECGVTACLAILLLGDGGVVVGQHVNLVNAVYAVVGCDSTTSLVIARDVALDNHSYARLTFTLKRIHTILYVVYREVVVASIVEVGGYSLTLLVEGGDVEYLAHVQQ